MPVSFARFWRAATTLLEPRALRPNPRTFRLPSLALIDGDIGQLETAQKVADLAIEKFGSIDALVANAGFYLVKPFTEYTRDDFRALVSTNLGGFIYIAQLTVKPDAGVEIGRQHRLHYCSASRQPDCRQSRLGCDDDERRLELDSEKPVF